MTVAFLDLSRQTRELERELHDSIDETLRTSRFVGGDAIARFENEWADFCGVEHAVACGSGADALALALRALGVGTGDEVITAANTCVPTAAAIVAAGATPVFADVDPETLTLDPASARAAMTPRTKAIVPVHLYGRCADVDALRELGVFVVEDAAHAHGAELRGRCAGSLGDAAAFSFYPTKNLGAFGDAGAVTTSDTALAERLRELREFGAHGTQSRLDTIQAAVLSAKLSHLERWNARRRELVARYGVEPEDGHVYHLLVRRFDDRDAVRARLAERGIETRVHYAPALAPLPVSARAAATVLSLPLYPQLTEAEVDEVRAAL